MGLHTLIQWADSTVNPTGGCDGCELWNLPSGVRECYAGTIHTRFSPSKAYPGPFEEISLHPGRMAVAARWPCLRGTARPGKPWLDGMPRVIFLGDMGDVLSRAVPFGYLRDEVVASVASTAGARHVWMLLTKQPARLAEFARWLVGRGIDWPENLWAGTSVTGRASLSRVRPLLDVPAAVRFLSVEPLREAVDLGFEEREQDGPDGSPYRPPTMAGQGIGLVIVGGQSGRGARPFDLAWARSIRDQCAAAGVPYFLKQIGANPFDSARRISIDGPDSHALMIDLRDSHGGAMEEWDADLRVRQFPAVRRPLEARP